MKYMGSKARFAKQIYNIICSLTPREGRAWVEPFAGGMNMVSNIPFDDGPRYAADINEYLIEMWKALASGWKPPETLSRDEYYNLKELFKNGKGEKHLIGFVGFNASYSGKWFGGYAGRVNTKAGVRDYYNEALRHIEKQLLKMKGVFYCNESYNKIIIPNNSIIYCDPPYEGTTKYKDDFNHSLFWEWVRIMSIEHDIYVSEYNAPSDFECVWEKQATSSLSANGKSGSNKNSVEKLFRLKNV